jgi:hypothetical protein
MNENSFYMVYREGQGNNAPAHKHLTRHDATLEAERLARQFPGNKFYVLEAVSCCIKHDVEWVQLSGVVPF